MSSKARTDASTPAAGMPSKGKAQEEPKGERLKVTSDADNAFASKKMHSPEKRKTTVQIDTDKLSANAKLAAALAATAPKRKVVPPPAPTPAPAPTAVDTGTGTSPEKATAKPASPGANPLDALAFACLAEEQMRDSTTFTAESEEVEEGGIQVRVNEIRCTDGMFSSCLIGLQKLILILIST